MRKTLLAITVLGVSLGALTACATKGYVNTQVGQASTKVDALTASLEEAQERIRQNETKITEAQVSANRATQTASAADTKATQADATAHIARAKAEDLGKAFDATSRRIVYEVALTETASGFKFGATTLPDHSKSKIDTMMTAILTGPKGAYFESEGHTDDVGSKEVNDRLGMERAEAVKSYLYERHKIPLHRMNVISYGEGKPSNMARTRSARAENRRVVIRVLN